jgi:hypothetical protein
MDETFGMYPAQCVRADAKLTRVVRNNHATGCGFFILRD